MPFDFEQWYNTNIRHSGMTTIALILFEMQIGLKICDAYLVAFHR